MSGLSFDAGATVAECAALHGYLTPLKPAGSLLEVALRQPTESGSGGVRVELSHGRERAEVLFPCPVAPPPPRKW